jgi:hypothetical protein
MRGAAIGSLDVGLMPGADVGREGQGNTGHQVDFTDQNNQGPVELRSSPRIRRSHPPPEEANARRRR